MTQSTNNKSRKGRWKTRLLIAFFLALGFGLMAYPFISNYIFEHRQDSLIETYQSQADTVDDQQEAKELERARKYNQTIFADHIQLQDPFKSENKTISQEEYIALLNVNGNGYMGYIEIPCINVNLPIYHGTAESVLENGVGHLEGTSLPVGGTSTHSVLTGHTGLNRAKLFTDLLQVKEGDQFYLYVLKEKLAYQVDQIEVVEPDDTEDLGVIKDKDYCTLITCTPYGINSQRLLVRGHRIPYVEEAVAQVKEEKEDRGESIWMYQYKRALKIGFAVVLFIAVVNHFSDRYQRRKRKEKKKNSSGS